MSQIYIVSTGMGKGNYMTANAVELLKKADLIVGYTKYIDDIKDLISGKEIYATGMMEEVARCKYVLEQALSHKKVALISNGDANVYGMAGLLMEIIEENNLWDTVEVTIEPGITSMLLAASKAGAPIMGDFAVISLSNMLTPIELIEKRLKNALEGDFVVGLYNPLSHTRKEPYSMYLKLLEKHRPLETPVVIAQNLGRDNEKVLLTNVKELLAIKADINVINMSTILIIGNSFTKFVDSGKKVITQRGYQNNYNYALGE